LSGHPKESTVFPEAPWPEGLPEVQAILRGLESLEQLEILLALAAEADQSHTFEELAQKTLVRLLELPDIGRHLLSMRLVTADGERRLRLSDEPRNRATVAEILRQYRENPTPIVVPLSASAIERARLVVDHARARVFTEE
jgi:hypothetical protein